MLKFQFILSGFQYLDDCLNNSLKNATMKLKQVLKRGIIVATVGVIVATGIGSYLFYKPHRDVQAAKTDYSLSAAQIVNEYLEDRELANIKYLAADGDSKILEITGKIAKISEDYRGHIVVLLKGKEDKAGVSATLSDNTDEGTSVLEIGDTIAIKGVIRSGASYDEDLELYEHVILDKCDIVKK